MHHGGGEGHKEVGQGRVEGRRCEAGRSVLGRGRVGGAGEVGWRKEVGQDGWVGLTYMVPF